ncbi:GPP34 family phosphoprotein [Lactobacillus terrae]|uniref:GPP34 family phosphoprotein n=1 Tax=Lactobacillus terrae TaxID=2269374 RepID=UPI000C1B7B49|nr:GPP34 family phosphoprotein [Lactobacillus terrae]
MNYNIPQKYFILACDEKGSTKIYTNSRKRAFLAASSFFDLAINDIIDLTEKSVIIKKVLPPEKEYLNQFFQLINKNQGKSVVHVLRSMNSEKVTKPIYNQIGDSLSVRDVVRKEVKGTIFNKYNNYFADTTLQNKLKNELTEEAFSNEKLDPETIAILSVLYNGHIVKNNITKSQMDELKSKFKDMEKDPDCEKIITISKRLNRTISTII